MFKIFSEGDKVIVDLCGRLRDLILSCKEADELAESLEIHANNAEKETPSLIKGEQWGAKVESYDGLVAIRFFPPVVSKATRIPMLPITARQIAQIIRFKKEQAEYKMRLVVKSLTGKR